MNFYLAYLSWCFKKIIIPKIIVISTVCWNFLYAFLWILVTDIVMSNHYFWTWAVERYFYVIFIYVVLLHCILRDWWWILMREMNICFYLILVMALVQYVPGVNSEQWLFNKHVHILKNDLLRSWLFKLIKELLIIPLNWVQFLSNEKKIDSQLPKFE